MYYLALFCFFFNDTATTEIYTLSLHDALPICLQGRRAEDQGAPGSDVGAPRRPVRPPLVPRRGPAPRGAAARDARADRKSTRLNSSHANISYAVFCLKKKKKAHLTSTSVSMHL